MQVFLIIIRIYKAIYRLNAFIKVITYKYKLKSPFIMFWACSVSGGKSFDLKSASKSGELLHVSHAVLHLNSSEENTVLYALQGKDKYPLAYLNKSKPTSSLDLYFEVSKGGSFAVEGKGEVSILGYFEPSDNEPSAKPALIEAESDSDTSEDDVPVGKNLEASNKDHDDSDLSEEEEEDSKDDQEEDSEDEDESDEDEDSDEDDIDSEEEIPQKHSGDKKPSEPVKKPSNDKTPEKNQSKIPQPNKLQGSGQKPIPTNPPSAQKQNQGTPNVSKLNTPQAKHPDSASKPKHETPKPKQETPKPKQETPKPAEKKPETTPKSKADTPRPQEKKTPQSSEKHEKSQEKKKKHNKQNII
jgi:hypothetical protein